MKKTICATGEITERLRQSILNGEYRPRERLVESELSDRYEVSRTPIREAIRNLAAIGMVKLVPYKGAVVADIDANEMKEIYAVRIELEGLATKLATPNITKTIIDELDEHLDKMQEHIENGDLYAFGTSNEQFHRLIYSQSGNETLISLLDDLFERCAVFRRSSWQSMGHIEKLMEGHRSILDAIEQGDAIRAQEEMKQHIIPILDNFNNR